MYVKHSLRLKEMFITACIDTRQCLLTLASTCPFTSMFGGFILFRKRKLLSLSVFDLYQVACCSRKDKA